jgi:hypothetical protein
MEAVMFQITRLEAQIKNNNHILHVLLSVITAGVWIPVWVLCCVRQGLINSGIRRQIRKLEKSL